MNKYKETYDALEHSGVKGMKWGVRKRIKAEFNSAKREFKLTKHLKERSTMSDEKLIKLTNRIRMENDLKRLSTGKKQIGLIRTKRMDRKEYLQRDKMSDEDLQKRIKRLQLEDNLTQQIMTATKRQREIGTSVVESAMHIGLSKAVGKDSFKSAIAKEVKNKMDNAVVKQQEKQKNNKDPFHPGNVAEAYVKAIDAKKKKQP